jgi:hypothetical protein
MVGAGGERGLRLGEVEDAQRGGRWGHRHRRGGGFGGPDAVEGPTWWWPPMADALMCCFFSGGSSVVVAHRWRALCCIFFFFSFVCRACQSEAHDKDLTICRASPERAHGKAGGRRPKRPVVRQRFCRARAMTHNKGCLPCVRC